MGVHSSPSAFPLCSRRLAHSCAFDTTPVPDPRRSPAGPVCSSSNPLRGLGRSVVRIDFLPRGCKNRSMSSKSTRTTTTTQTTTTTTSRRRFREVFLKFSQNALKTMARIFFEKQISSTRSIWSKNHQNPSYPRDFSAVRSFGVPKKSNFRKAVYPPRMAPFGLKLWENAFQTIPDILFFDAGKKIGKNFQIFVNVFLSENRRTACF